MRFRLACVLVALLAAVAGGGSAAASDELCIDAGGPLGMQIPPVCIPMP